MTVSAVFCKTMWIYCVFLSIAMGWSSSYPDEFLNPVGVVKITFTRQCVYRVMMALWAEARSRLRMAEEWLRNWSRLPDDLREMERVSDQDRAFMALSHLDIHGSDGAAHSLRIWQPRELSYTAGRILASRLLDHGRAADLDRLAVSAGNDIGLILAIAVESRDAHRPIPDQALKRCYRILTNSSVVIEEPGSFDNTAVFAVTALVEHAFQQGIGTSEECYALLSRYLPQDPPRGIAARYGNLTTTYLRAYALAKALTGNEAKPS